ncbi:MAG: hypothetical protein U5J97_05170 [Trueperaceae bacterium]|nr:hypothetical protein [Trueperaceae bacterium]
MEILRNTPLAVQIIFWFTAALATLPPTITAPLRLPGGVYLSNRGLAFPFAYPGFGFDAWLPWLIAALVAYVVVMIVQRRRIARSDRPGRAWPLALLVPSVALAGGGYYVASSLASAPPEALAVELTLDRGRGVTFRDVNGDGAQDRGERNVGHVPLTIRIEEGLLEARSQNLVEQRRVKASTLRFPILEQGEFAAAELPLRERGGRRALRRPLAPRADDRSPVRGPQRRRRLGRWRRGRRGRRGIHERPDRAGRDRVRAPGRLGP